MKTVRITKDSHTFFSIKIEEKNKLTGRGNVTMSEIISDLILAK